MKRLILPVLLLSLAFAPAILANEADTAPEAKIASERQIDYGALMAEIKIGIVRKLLSKASTQGLPGGHYFYIEFLTEAPGVQLDPQLVEKYRPAMTIALQYQFENLMAHNDGFEVTLVFDDQPTPIYIPYAAITSFHDPSVGFALSMGPGQPEQ